MGAEVSDAASRHLDKGLRERDSEQRKTKRTRESALERAERREWAHKKYGTETRWKE